MPRLTTVRFLGTVLAGLLAAGCGGGSGPAPTYSIGGRVSGLAGSGLELADSSGDMLALSTNGTFTIATAVSPGASYSVRVSGQPQNPSQTCLVANGSGTMGSAPVTSVAVTCTTNQYTVGGQVTGLLESGLVLANNGGDATPVSGSGPFTLTNEVASGAMFSISVQTQPPNETCAVSNGGGTVGSSAITGVTVACTAQFDVNTIAGPTYQVVAYDGAGQSNGAWAIAFDGSGNVSGSGGQNNSGVVTSGAASGTYAVAVEAAAGIPLERGLTLSLNGGPTFTGQVSLDDRLLVMSQLTPGQNSGLAIGIRQGQSDFADANLAGTFSMVSYGSAATIGRIATLTFDGAGNVSGSQVQNSAGTISSNAVSGTYTVAANGAVTATFTGMSPLTGGLSADGNALLLAQLTPGQSPGISVAIKQGPTDFVNANMNGTYAVASYDESGTDGALWALAFNGSGAIAGAGAQNGAGTVSSVSGLTETYVVAADGALTVNPVGGGLLMGGIGAQGTFVTSATAAGNPAGIQIAALVSLPWVSLSPQSTRFLCYTENIPPYSGICEGSGANLTLKNSGTTPLYIFGTVQSGTAPGFSINNNCPASLSAGQSCTITEKVQFVAHKIGLSTGTVAVLVNTVPNADTAFHLTSAWSVAYAP
jgi:large repetitive protein